MCVYYMPARKMYILSALNVHLKRSKHSQKTLITAVTHHQCQQHVGTRELRSDRYKSSGWLQYFTLLLRFENPTAFYIILVHDDDYVEDDIAADCSRITSCSLCEYNFMNESCGAVFEYHMNRETVRICTSGGQYCELLRDHHSILSGWNNFRCWLYSFLLFMVPIMLEGIFLPQISFHKPRPASDIGLVHQVACSSRFFLKFCRVLITILTPSLSNQEEQLIGQS